jgi:hypothetical protein
MYNHYSNFGCSFVMVWDWAGHIVGRTLSLGSDRSHCGKNTQFGTEPVTLWGKHLVWDWAGYTVGTTLGLGQDHSHCGKNTLFWTGPDTLWEEQSVWDWAGYTVGRTQAECV